MTCQVLQELGYGLTRSIVNDIVCHFLKDQKKENPFKDGIPGYDWWEGFLGRWPSLRERKPLQDEPLLQTQKHWIAGSQWWAVSSERLGC